jgi:hypothetical protein
MSTPFPLLGGVHLTLRPYHGVSSRRIPVLQMTQHFLALRRGAILGDDAMTMSHSRTPSVRECKQAGRGIFEQVILTPPIEREDLLSRMRKARQPVTFIHQIRPSRPVQYLSDNCHTRWFVLDRPAYPQLSFSQQRHSP